MANPVGRPKSSDQTAAETYCPICEVLIEGTIVGRVAIAPNVVLAAHLQVSHGRALRAQVLGGADTQ